MIDKAMSIAVSVNFMSNFIIVLTFPFIVSGIGLQYTFWFYGIVAALAVPWCIFGMTETKGRRRESIFALFVKT